ncbi:hypothetical protein MMC21_003698 [Puttea exsequens]|nr:hypothetical protein [Puttea exsequens]
MDIRGSITDSQSQSTTIKATAPSNGHNSQTAPITDPQGATTATAQTRGPISVAPDYSITDAFRPELSKTTIMASNGAVLIYSISTLSDMTTHTGIVPFLIFTTIEQTDSHGHHTHFIGGLWVGGGGRYWGPPGIPKPEIIGEGGPDQIEVNPPCFKPFCSGWSVDNGLGGGAPGGDPPTPPKKPDNDSKDDDDDDEDERTATKRDPTRTKTSHVSTAYGTITLFDQGYTLSSMDLGDALARASSIDSLITQDPPLPDGPLWAPANAAESDDAAQALLVDPFAAGEGDPIRSTGPVRSSDKMTGTALDTGVSTASRSTAAATSAGDWNLQIPGMMGASKKPTESSGSTTGTELSTGFPAINSLTRHDTSRNSLSDVSSTRSTRLITTTALDTKVSTTSICTAKNVPGLCGHPACAYVL